MERLKKLYQKEEEFLDEYGQIVKVAVRVLKGKWEPNYSANDNTRKNQEYFLPTGEIKYLVFDSASVYHDNNGFSSAQIILKSVHRLVNVRVRVVNSKLVGEKIVDRPIN
jgi:hypothetical protein